MSMPEIYSFSDLDAHGRCPQSYYYRTIVKIQKRRQDPKLQLGSMIHRLLMARYLGTGVNAEYHLIIEEIEANPRLFADEKEAMVALANEAQRIVDGYLDFYRDDWEVLHVEEQFIITMDDGNSVSFTPDLIVRDRNGFVWVIDHKSTTALPSEQVFTNLQPLIYFAGVQKLYPELKGFIFNYLRKKTPTEPRLAKTGNLRVADLNRIDTTFEILRDFLQSEAPQLLDDMDHKLRLAELRDNPKFYYRKQLVITSDMVNNALNDVSAQIAAIQTGRFYRVYIEKGMRACSSCEYQPICQADLLGWDSEAVLREQYEPRDPKNQYDTYEEVEF